MKAAWSIRILLSFIAVFALTTAPLYAADPSVVPSSARATLDAENRNSSNPFLNFSSKNIDPKPAQPAAFTIPVYSTAEWYIVSLINFILDFIGLIVIAMIVYGGFQYVLAMGDSGKLKKAKGIITASIVGFFIVVIAFALVATIITATKPGVNDCAGVQSAVCINSSGQGVNFGVGAGMVQAIGSIF